MCVRVFLCCVVLWKERPCVGPIPHPRSPINCPNIFMSFRKIDFKREQAKRTNPWKTMVMMKSYTFVVFQLQHTAARSDKRV
jgi:hypothetical protein